MSYLRIFVLNYYTNLLKLPDNNQTIGQDNQFMIGEFNRQGEELRACRSYLEAGRLEAGRLEAGHLEQVGRLKKANRYKCMIIVAGVIVACAVVFYMIYKT